MGSAGATTSADLDALLKILTLREKISLLAGHDWWRTPVVQRQGVFVPPLKTTDGPNGARGESYVSGIKAACMPCGTCIGATFDERAAYRMGVEIANEARTKAAHVLLAPTLNVIRSPLGGRNYETYSEDPLLLGRLAAAFVNGCQSQGIAATPKHFVANEAEDQRKKLSVEVDMQTLREIYLRPFQLVMALSKPLCFMTSYNRINGTYAADSRWLIEDVLRREWGFSGLVMSDWMGTYSTVNCMNAGMDLEMPGPTKWRGELLEEAVSTGAVSEETVTKSARRVLELLQKLGRFEDPSEPPELEVENPRRNEIIAQTGADGMVLLKNDGGLLPISRERSTSVAMIGHHASLASLGGGGSARVDAIHSVTPIEGLRHLGFDVRTSPGVPVYATLPHPNHDIVFPPGQRVHTDCPVRVEWFNGSKVGHNRVLEEWKPTAEYMVKEKWPSFLDHDYCTRMSYDVRPTSGGDHVVSVITTGRAVLCINGETVFERAQPTDMAMEQFYFYKSKLEQRLTYHMEAQQQYTLSLETWATDPDILNGPPLFGKFYQGASLRFQEHIDVRRRLQDAANVASNANIAIVCVGTTNEIESDGFDRTTLALAGEQYELIRAVSQVNPKTVVVNFSGAPVSMIEFVDTVPAIVHASFPGQECGHSLARVLTGITNPSGRLPFSWPRAIQDNPSYGNFPVGKDMKLHYPEGLDVGYRHYLRAESSEPLFPFGFGLSYTDFEISNLRAGSAGVIPAGPQGAIDIFCDVQNIGQERTGRCVVQLYVSLPATKIGRRRPIRELAGFYKIELRPLEKKTVRLSLDKYSTSIYDESVSRWRGLRGEFKVYTGISSVDVAHEILVVRDDEFTWTGV